MSWFSLIENVLPFLGGGGESKSSISPFSPMEVRPWNNSKRTSNNPVEYYNSNLHWLYTWEKRSNSLADDTVFLSTIGHFQFTDLVGHPWCNSGYGDAMTLAISQLMKSEVAVMLNNAASNIESKEDQSRAKRGGLAWDESSGRFARLQGNDTTDAGVVIPLLASIVAKFFDDTSIGSKMRSVTDMVCQLSDAEAEAQLFSDSVYFCFVEDLVAATLICGESEMSVKCPKSLKEYEHTKEDFPSNDCVIANTSLHKGTVPNRLNFNDQDLIMPLLMVDLLKSSNERRLPRFIPTKVSLQESLTYLLLYRSCIIAASYSRQPYLCGADKVNAPTLIPGWSLPMVLNLMPEGDPIFAAKDLRNDAVPLVFISQSKVSPCSFLVTVRGTATMVEWIQDFEYWQTPFMTNPKAKTHVGFTRILSSILPSLELFMTQQSEKHQCSCRNTHVFFTGHSLGAGVAQLLALHFANKYKSEKGCPLDISAVVFAPPRVFNAYGAEQWRRTVNGRIVLDSGDGLAYMPCYEGNSNSGWARCSKGHMPHPGRGRDHYADNYGIVEINVEYLDKKGGRTLDTLMQSLFPSGTDHDEPSVLSTLFSKLVELGVPGLGRIPSLGAMGASHVCSAACKFSQAACGNDFKWWCDKCPMLL